MFGPLLEGVQVQHKHTQSLLRKNQGVFDTYFLARKARLWEPHTWPTIASYGFYLPALTLGRLPSKGKPMVGHVWASLGWLARAGVKPGSRI